MKFLKKLFKSTKIECPRCLGKSYVDWEDIKRLDMELKWVPGNCAYCQRTGKVEKDVIQKINIDEAYLTINISNQERIRLLNGNTTAKENAKNHNREIEKHCSEIVKLHEQENLSIDQIVYHFINKTKDIDYLSANVDDWKVYVERVLNARRNEK